MGYVTMKVIQNFTIQSLVAVSYSPSTATTALFRISSDIKPDICCNVARLLYMTV